MEHRVTIKDVALRANVSITAVSLVLNNKGSAIPKETQNRIYLAAKELNYRPNQLALGLVQKRTRIIGLIIPDNDNLFFSTYSNYLMKAASELGYNLILGNADNDVLRVIETMQMFEDRLMDAIILAQSEFPNPEDSQKCLQAISKIQIPVILIDRLDLSSPFEYAVLDHELGGKMAAQYLLERGHRQIGFITGPLSFSSCSKRLEGYKTALEEFGVPFNHNLIYEGPISTETAISALPVLLGQSCTAICAFNDMMAYGIYRELQNYGLSVPYDISIVGFDDLLFSEYTNPPLTTIAQPLDKISRFVMQHLHQLIEFPDKGHPLTQHVFKPVLKARGSVRPIRESAKQSDAFPGRQN
ncbi:MAG: LacI family transcriptional regulator [Clostridiales bacterium]|nr:LacI family transcriptional regulator [Clostridiales bacterium]